MDSVYKFDIMLIGVSLVALIFVVGYASPLVIAPLDEYESDGNVLFVIEKAEVLLIDDNVDFSSPDEYGVEEGLEIRLEPGEYYWKAVGALASDVRTLTIKSVVDLELVRVGDGFGVVNGGNVRLDVDVYDGGELVDKVKLGVGMKSETSFSSQNALHFSGSSQQTSFSAGSPRVVVPLAVRFAGSLTGQLVLEVMYE